jgi:hypothetical protein
VGAGGGAGAPQAASPVTSMVRTTITVKSFQMLAFTILPPFLSVLVVSQFSNNRFHFKFASITPFQLFKDGGQLL